MEYTYEDDGTILVRVPSPHGPVPWVTVTRSDMLESLGVRGQAGVFAARQFESGETVGRYLGQILGRHKDPRMSAKAESMYAVGTGSFLMGVDGYVVDGSRPPQSDQQQMNMFGRILFPGGRDEYPGSLST
jgi:hypothetical protein